MLLLRCYHYQGATTTYCDHYSLLLLPLLLNI